MAKTLNHPRHACMQIRRKLVTHSTLNMMTGETAEAGQEWHTEACGAPLWSDEERETGFCRSCLSGWTHPDNFPLTAEAV